MSADYTTTGLLAKMKRRGFIPAGCGLTTSDLLQVLTGELRNYIPAFLKGIREEFIIAEMSIPVTGASVPVPVRACGIALRTIGWTRSDGTIAPLTRVEPERRGDFGLSGEPSGFMFRGNNCILVPAAISGTLVVSYQQRPGELVLPTSCAIVNGGGPGNLVVDAGFPAEWDDTMLYDVVSSAPNFGLQAMDLAGEPAGTTFIPSVSAATANVTATSYICRATETCVPQIPLECFDLLAQAAAVEIAQSTGSTRLAALREGLEGKDGRGGLRAQVAMILSPRSDGNARVIVNRSRLGRRGL